ncbi:alanine-tRNA ligase [Batrachochytrium salamandrivorans]|nr:alanine-tRNA ligase [Batrachochytrium salamandrivorans]
MLLFAFYLFARRGKRGTHTPPPPPLILSQTMDALKRATEHIRHLESRVRELEQTLAEKTNQLSLLANEVPGGARKFERLGMSTASKPLSPQEWPSNRVRQTFLDYFQSKDHVFWKSSPVIPPSEETTLMFANSGMNQFKPVFLGQADPKSEIAKLKRACNTQKCLRAGGKHNDLDDVGRDSYHHSFFEMLGNWSFGDFFKKEAIAFAWELLTVKYGIDPSRLYATYFQGNADVPADEEAKQLWLQYLPPNHVLPFPEKENFWEMGATGPCGPCTEIHYDRVGNRDASALVNQDDPLCLEIWNLVFIQYNRNEDRSLTPLPSQHVDTGMGFERLCSVLQNKMSNYDIDLFVDLFAQIQAKSTSGPYQGRYGADDVDLTDTAYRVVCDHLRALCHAIADGCQPDRSDRGYVLRRILRRAVRHGKETLKCEDYFLSNLVESYALSVKATFPEVYEKREHVRNVIHREEADFMRTIKQGREFFTQIAAKNKLENKTEISGEDCFFMFATHGFPFDLTEIMAHEIGMTVDTKRFHEKMEEERLISSQDHKSKMGAGGQGETGRIPKLDAFATDYLDKHLVQPTLALEAKLHFTPQSGKGKVVAIFDPRTKSFVEETLEDGQVYGVVLDQTNFYHESGGQVADIGQLCTDESSGVTFQVKDVQSSKGFVVHSGFGSNVRVGQELALLVDLDKRAACAKNHTSTHLLNLALRSVLQVQVDQKGSLVDEEKLRFDFDFGSALDAAQLEGVEKMVGEEIARNLPVYAKVVPLAEAKQISTLRAVFGEIYPDPVRVTSVELCGGSHMESSGQAEAFVLVSDEGVAKGVRRVVGLTGKVALQAKQLADELRQQVFSLPAEAKLGEIELLQRTIMQSTISKVTKLQLEQQLTVLHKRAADLEKQEEKKVVQQIVTELNGLEGDVLVVDVGRGRDIKLVELVAKDVLKKRPVAMFIFCQQDDTTFASCAVVHDQLLPQLKANEWMNTLSPEFGRGGGKPAKANLRGGLCPT